MKIFANYIDTLLTNLNTLRTANNLQANDEKLKEILELYEEKIELYFSMRLNSIKVVIDKAIDNNTYNFYLAEKLFHFSALELKENLAYEVASFMPLLCNGSGQRFTIKNFFNLTAEKCTSYFDLDSVEIITSRIVIIGICLGVIDVDIRNMNSFPSLGINDFYTQDETVKKLVFISKLLSCLDEPQFLQGDRVLNQLQIFAEDSFSYAFYAFCSNYNVQHNLEVNKIIREAQENINKQEETIKSLHLQIIEIVSIIIAVFSIIGINVFSLSRSEDVIMVENIILINLTLSISIVAIFGLIEWIIKKEKLPKGYFVLIALLVIGIGCIVYYNVSKECDIIYKIIAYVVFKFG